MKVANPNTTHAPASVTLPDHGQLSNPAAARSLSPRTLNRILALLFVLFIVPVLLAQYWIFRREEREIVEIEQNRTLTRVRTIAELTVSELRTHLRLLQLESTRPNLLESWQRRDLPGLDRHLQDVLRVAPELKFVAMHDLAGTVHRVMPPDPIVGTNFAYRNWYRGVTAEWKPYVSELYRTRMLPDQLVVGLAVPVKDNQGRPVGILMAALSPEALARTLRDTQEGVVGEAYVVDQNGHVVASPALQHGSEPVSAPNREFVDKALAGQEVTDRTGTGFAGYIVSAGPVPTMKWAVLYRRPASAALAAVANLRRDLFTVTAYLTFIFLGAAAVAIGATRRYQRGVRAREKAEQEVVEQRALLQSIIESAGEGISVANERGELILINATGERICGRAGLNLAEAEWSQYFEVFRPDGATPFPAHELPLARAVRGETVRNEEAYIRRPDGQGVVILITAQPMRDATGAVRGGVATFLDITQRKAAEEQLWKLNRALQARTEELETVNRELEAFTYSVSHDLRAPLRHVDGFSQILLQKHTAQLDDQGQHYLKRVRDGAQQMGRLVDDLLNLSRVGRQEFRPVLAGLDHIVQEVLRELEMETRERQIEWRIGNLPFVECDPLLMRQVFANLLSNSVKYTRTRPRAVIEVGPYGKNSATGVFVRDNGVGFSMKYADKLFGIFQRLHRQEDFEGTGVGLATVQRIIHRHGGRVWAEAELDQGATFYFTLGDSAQERLPETVGVTERGNS